MKSMCSIRGAGWRFGQTTSNAQSHYQVTTSHTTHNGVLDKLSSKFTEYLQRCKTSKSLYQQLCLWTSKWGSLFQAQHQKGWLKTIGLSLFSGTRPMNESTLARARWFSGNQHSAIFEGSTRKKACAAATITEPKTVTSSTSISANLNEGGFGGQQDFE